MKRLAGALALVSVCAVAALATPGGAADRKSRRGQLGYASPGAIVAAEVAFAQLAQSKGQWTAFRATAAQDAVMFVPRPVIARDWLKSQKDPPRAVTWQPHQVWLSCDGSLALSYGAWQRPDGRKGYFTTVWQRQKKGDYKWVLDQGDDLGTALPAPEMIGASVATCDRKAGPPPAASPTPAPAFPAGTRGGWSQDRTLSWAVVTDANCGRALTVSLYRGAGKPMEPVLEKRVAPPTGADGKPSAVCPVA